VPVTSCRVVAAVGVNVRRWKTGDRLPSVRLRLRDMPSMPLRQPAGVRPSVPARIHHWGSFAEYVAIDNADLNVVRLPKAWTSSLQQPWVSIRNLLSRPGRSGTRAARRVGRGPRLRRCGLSAIMIARPWGQRRRDRHRGEAAFARKLGADATLDSAEARSSAELVNRIAEVTEAARTCPSMRSGAPRRCFDSVSCCASGGIADRLLLGEQPPCLPMDKVVGRELEILAPWHPGASLSALFAMILSGALDPAALVGERISLEQSARAPWRWTASKASA